jgi:hypothetical protein
MMEEEKVEQKEEDVEWVVLSGNQIICTFPEYEEAFSYMINKSLPNPRVMKSKPGKAMDALNVYKQSKKIFN